MSGFVERGRGRPSRASLTTVAAPLSRIELAMREPCVVKWFDRLGSETSPSYRSSFKYWLMWLWAHGDEYATVTPTRLLDLQESRQKDESTRRERYEFVDLMIEHIEQRGGTYKSMTTRMSHLRSFFLHNRVELPGTADWNPKPTREPTQGRLNLGIVREIIQHANLRDTAVILTLFQGIMDLERFAQFNRKYAEPLVKHLHEASIDDPFRVDFVKGRKRNRKGFHTYLYRDALTAWKNYFEKERGWPKPTEPLAVTIRKTPPTKYAVRAAFITLAKRIRARPKNPYGQRTGVSPHELRDVARTLLQTAQQEKFDVLVAEFFMGHTIDPHNYVKFAELEPKYVLENAKIAAQYLNIISDVQPTKDTTRINELTERIIALETNLKALQGEGAGLQAEVESLGNQG